LTNNHQITNSLHQSSPPSSGNISTFDSTNLPFSSQPESLVVKNEHKTITIIPSNTKTNKNKTSASQLTTNTETKDNSGFVFPVAYDEKITLGKCSHCLNTDPSQIGFEAIKEYGEGAGDGVVAVLAREPQEATLTTPDSIIPSLPQSMQNQTQSAPVLTLVPVNNDTLRTPILQNPIYTRQNSFKDR